jgi:hypothetical protein
MKYKVGILLVKRESLKSVGDREIAGQSALSPCICFRTLQSCGLNTTMTPIECLRQNYDDAIHL